MGFRTSCTRFITSIAAAVLALNSSVSQVGSIMAPLLGGFLLLSIGWRHTFFVVAILSVFMAVAYFFFRDRVRDTTKTGESNRAKLARSMASYLRLLRNRNFMLIALVFLVGGAGRGEVMPTYGERQGFDSQSHRI